MLIMLRLWLRLRLRLSRSPNLALAGPRDLGSGTLGPGALQLQLLLPNAPLAGAGCPTEAQGQQGPAGPGRTRPIRACQCPEPTGGQCPFSVSGMPEPEVSQVASIATPANKPARQPACQHSQPARGTRN